MDCSDVIGVRYFWVSLLLSVSLAAHAQIETLRFEHLTINDGLSQSSVNAMIEDREGFLWVGTQDGLNRFDGYDFVVFRHDSNNPHSLSSNNVATLYLDRDGTLWVGTTGGTLHRYDRASETFDRFPLPRSPNSGVGSEFFGDIRQVLQADDGQFWIGTRARGLMKFDPSTGLFQNIEAVSQLKINSLLEGPDGVLWIGTDKQGLVWYSPASGKATRGMPASPDQVYALTESQSGEIWVGGDLGIVNRFNADREFVAAFSTRLPTGIQNFEIRSIIEDHEGRLWVGSIGGGLQAFAQDGRRLASFLHAPSDPFSLSTNTVFTQLLDSAGVLWVGSLAAGLSKANLAGARFVNFWHQPEDPTSLGHNMVNEFAEDEAGNIWIGTSGGGVDRLDRATGTFVHFRADPSDPAKLSSNRVWGMHLEEDTGLWVGTWGGGLNLLDTETGTVRRFTTDSQTSGAMPGNVVTTIVSDGDGGLWIGTADAGLIRKGRDSDRFERHYLLDSRIESEKPVNISAGFLDASRRLWIGTWTNGLCVLEKPDSPAECFSFDAADTRSINANNIRAINQDLSGQIWIATADGISRFDEASRTFERYTTKDGLPVGTIYGILFEERRYLWLSSNQGLVRLDTVNRDARRYVYRDGLQANEFNGAAYLQSRDGTFFFGGIGGITSFDPALLADNQVPPKVTLTELRLFNERVAIDPEDPDATLRQSLAETGSIVLRYNQNVLSIGFAGLHFVSPELNSYAHRLEGFDRDWVYTDATQRFATYTNLDPGEYEFRVRAANADGLWSTPDATLKVVVMPPWWMTWWARSLTLIAALLTVLLFIRWRVGLLRVQTRQLESEVKQRTRQVTEQKETIEKQAVHLEEVLEAKNQFFARLSHEFRTPITLMLGPIEEQLEQAPRESDRRALSMARRNGRRLLHLVNQLLGLAQHTGEQSIELVPVNVGPIAKILADSFLPLCVRKELDLNIDVDDNVWVRGNAEGLQIVLSNLLSNAIKYTNRSGRVDLGVHERDEFAVVTVKDSGCGIDEEHLSRIFNLFERGTATGPGSGIGLTLVKELVNAHDGSIDIQSTAGQGTVVEVRFPALVADEATADPAAILGYGDLELFADTEDLASDSAEPVGDETRLPQVLVVEDNSDMRHYVVDLLAQDYYCIEAPDGKEGLEIAAQELPDLVISDVMMPNKDGFEFLRGLRDDTHTSHIPVIMLTALDDQESRLKGLAERADDYISKPFDRSELVLRVRNLLELSRIRARRMGQLLYSSTAAVDSVTAVSDGLNQRDKAFLQKLEQTVDTHYQDAGFGLEQLADAMFMSPRQLQRKLRALLDTAPAAYLRDFRLKVAKQELEAGRAVKDVAFATGFSSVSYFGKRFKSRFDMKPSDLLGD